MRLDLKGENLFALSCAKRLVQYVISRNIVGRSSATVPYSADSQRHTCSAG
jgi:hypothetical protein